MSDAVRPPPGRTDRCIVWRRRARLVDREVLDALARRSLVVTQCEGPYEAIAALCRAAPDRGALVLLLMDPAQLSKVDEVCAAAKRYAPRTVTWAFETTSRRLRAFTAVEAPVKAKAPEPSPAPEALVLPPTEPKVATTRPGRIGPPKLKLAGEGTLPPVNEPAEDQALLSANRGSALPARQVLTDEELAMLLSPGPIRGNG